MLSDSQGMTFSAPYLIFIPGMAIMITMMAYLLEGAMAWGSAIVCEIGPN